jgi:hypothetical protein
VTCRRISLDGADPLRAAFALLAAALLACGGTAKPEQKIYANPLDSLGDVLTKSGVAADASVSSDGHGSIRIDATGPTTVALAEVRPAAAEDVTLFYRARLRSEGVTGQAYLEMWCQIPGMGEFFSRALQDPLTGTSDWRSQATPFLLQAGQRAELVKLNVVVTGPGRLWIDDLSLSQAEH